LNHRKKTKADGSRLIPRKHTETLVLLNVEHSLKLLGIVLKLRSHIRKLFSTGFPNWLWTCFSHLYFQQCIPACQ